jgi:hypothetical protein
MLQSGVASHAASKDLQRHTFCVAPTWRTGQKALKAFMEKNVPESGVYV